MDIVFEKFKKFFSDLEENSNKSLQTAKKIKKEKSLKDIVKNDLKINIEVTKNINNTEYGYEKELAKHKERCGNINLNQLMQIKNVKDVELEPEEILFLSYIDERKANNYDYPRYWTTKYDLNFQKTLLKLFEGGYLKFADSNYKLKSLKVTELKDVLRRYDLKVSGKKSVLVQRIIDTLNTDEISKLSKDEYFQVTDKGLELIDNNIHIKYFHDNPGLDISIHQAHNIIRKNSEMNHFSLALDILQKRIAKKDELKDHNFLRIEFYNISRIYNDIEDYHREFTYILMVIAMDLFEGLLEYEKLKNDSIIEYFDKNTINELKERTMLAPAIITRLIELKYKLNIEDIQLKENMKQVVKKLPISIPEILFEKRFNLLLDEIQDYI